MFILQRNINPKGELIFFSRSLPRFLHIYSHNNKNISIILIYNILIALKLLKKKYKILLRRFTLLGWYF